ncbi:histone-lysine N-methyltransferase SETMAR [Trichonephila clavipes]|nr:histone-lysine N-methyltransferase SETMAR [Trichonephila clavipes]
MVSRLEVRTVIRFLRAKNVCASGIHSQIMAVYGEEAMSRQHVVKSGYSFQSSRQDVESHNMTGNGRPSSSTTEITTARIGEMIQNDRRLVRRLCSGCGSLVVEVSERGWHITSSSPVPLKTHRVGQRCTLNMSKVQRPPVGGVDRTGGVSSVVVLDHGSKLRGP